MAAQSEFSIGDLDVHIRWRQIFQRIGHGLTPELRDHVVQNPPRERHATSPFCQSSTLTVGYLMSWTAQQAPRLVGAQISRQGLSQPSEEASKGGQSTDVPRRSMMRTPVTSLEEQETVKFNFVNRCMYSVILGAHKSRKVSTG